MKLGVVKESDGESRVAIVPGSVKKLVKLGFDVLIESGAGLASHNIDSDYIDAGATVTNRSDALSADIVVSIGMPEIDAMKEGQMLACVADPFRSPEKVK